MSIHVKSFYIFDTYTSLQYSTQLFIYISFFVNVFLPPFLLLFSWPFTFLIILFLFFYCLDSTSWNFHQFFPLLQIWLLLLIYPGRLSVDFLYSNHSRQRFNIFDFPPCLITFFWISCFLLLHSKAKKEWKENKWK